MIEYIKLFWEDAPEGEPSVILYEVDTENERLALRSIDISADGRTRNIPDLYDGAIEITPIPTAVSYTHLVGAETPPHNGTSIPGRCCCRKTFSLTIPLDCLHTLYLFYRDPMDFRSIRIVAG